MRFVLYTDHYSPHEVPLFLACCDVFDEAVYLVNRGWSNESSRKGWSPNLNGRRTIELQSLPQNARRALFAELLTHDSILMYGCFDNPYNEIISNSTGIVIYASERWLKPLCIKLSLLNCRLKIPGIFHFLSLRFVRRLISIYKRMTNGNRFYYFPEGIHAARDMARLCGLMHGGLHCLFKSPVLDFERRPGGRIWVRRQYEDVKTQREYCLDKMRMWGYFVEPSKHPLAQLTHSPTRNSSTLKVLWVGRLLDWKRIDTIVRAVGEHDNSKRMDISLPYITLDIYGEGPEEHRLKKLATQYGEAVRFHPFVPIAKVRELMHSHDVYVLSSNEYEGWGAVVSEALEEGMCVICTQEAGAGATILPQENLFPVGDYHSLMKKLRELPRQHRGIADWCAKYAAGELYKLVKEHIKRN